MAQVATAKSTNGTTTEVFHAGPAGLFTVHEVTKGVPKDNWTVALQYSEDGTNFKDTGILVRRATAVKGHAFVLPSGITLRGWVQGLADTNPSTLDVHIS